MLKIICITKLLFLVFGSLAGCGLEYESNGRPVKSPFYDIRIADCTGQEIADSDVFFDGMQTAGGRLLPPAGQANFYPGPDPIPERAHLVWKLADGRQFQADPEVLKFVHHPASFKGAIQFRLYADKVRTVVLSEEDLDHFHGYDLKWVPPDLKDDEGYAPAHPVSPTTKP